MKTVKIIDLIKLLYGVANLFEAQDENYPDGRTVAARERAVGHYLGKITSSAEEQRKIRDTRSRRTFFVGVGNARNT